MLRPPRSLQARLLLPLLVTVVGVWIGTALLTWFDARHELDELLDGHLAQAAALLVVQQVEEIEDAHRMDAPTLHRYAPKVAFQVFHESRLVLRSLNAPAAPMLAAGDGAGQGFRTVEIAGRPWRVFAARGAERDVQVYVGEQLGSRAAILWAVLRSTLWPLLAALPLLALAAWWAVSRGVAPLRRLGRALAERPADALQPVRLDGAASEMVPMIDALNGLFGRIGGLLESERRFTADAAHELRTPIAAIRAQAQVAMGATDDAERRRALQLTLDGCDRATRLVEQLLTLSRLEAQGAGALATLDLRALLQRVVAEAAPRALARRQALTLDAPEPARVAGDETLLAVLLRNLLDNAVRYSPPAARIELRLQREGGRVLLKLDDSGPGLACADLQRLGERFFRVPGSEASGSGLGWSIARRIAAVHGAELQAGRSAALGGLGVRLSLAEAG